MEIQTKLCPSSGKAKRKVTANSQKKYHKLLLKLDREMKHLEYVLDRENQRRKRQDPVIKKAWGYLFYWKGLVYDALGYYQPTLGVFFCSWKQDKLNPTWTKRRAKLHLNVQRQKVLVETKETKLKGDRDLADKIHCLKNDREAKRAMWKSAEQDSKQLKLLAELNHQQEKENK